VLTNAAGEPQRLRTASDALETLREVNSRLRSALVRLQPEQSHCSAITPQDFSDLRTQIRRAAECLQLLAPDSVAIEAVGREAAAYRSHLESLQHFLPDLYGRLLAEKSRLEVSRNRVAATKAWARASEKTL